MKIKQDRASRTYELQVCVISGGGGCSPGLPPRRHTLHTPKNLTGLSIFLRTCTSSLALSQRGLQCPWCHEPDRPVVSATPPLFPGLFPAPSLAMTYLSPIHLLSLLIPSPLHCCSPTSISGCSSPPVFISHFQFFSPSHWSLRSEGITSCQTPAMAPLGSQITSWGHQGNSSTSWATSEHPGCPSTRNVEH